MKKLFDEVLKRIKANKITLCILIICFILFGIILNRIITKEYNGEHEYCYNNLTQGDGRTPSITAGQVISQKFVVNRNNFHQIGIFTLMPSISTDSTVNVKILEVQNNIEIFNQDVFLGSVNDGEFFEIFLENQAKSKNKEYELIITGIDGNEFNSVQFPYSSYPNDLLGECCVSGNKQENSIIIKRTITNYISNKLQLLVWCILLVVSIIFVLLFSNDKDLIFKNLNLDLKSMFFNLKTNWYWLISIEFLYMLFIRSTKLQYCFIIFANVLIIFILTQVKSIKEKVKNINLKFKIFAILSTIGTCYYTKNLFLKKFFEKAEFNYSVLNLLAIFSAIMSSFIIFALITIFLDYTWNKIKDVFEDMSKKEKSCYVILLVGIIIFISYMFLNSTAFYGTEDALFDVLFVSDSGRLVLNENVYLSLYHGENDLRQPLFAIFAIPFVGAGYAVSLLFPFINSAAPLFMNLVQVILFFTANLMIAKMLTLKPIERITFVILSFCTYMSLLFSVMMEQYLIAYFWLITFIYLIYKNKQDELTLSAAGGTLLTSLVLAPFIINEFSIKKIKEHFISLLKAGIVFVCMFIIFNRIDLLEDLFFKGQEYSTFVDNEMNFEYKSKAYTRFVRNCFIYPETYISEDSVLCPYSYQMVENETISYVGIGIIILAILGFILNRKDKLSIISILWCIFSYIIIGVIGWGTAENGTILYSLYFGWSFFVLIYKLLKYICDKLKIKNLLVIVTVVLIILLVTINFEGGKELFNFALTYYKV